MACGQQVLHASCCLTHCSAPGGYNQGPSRYQKSAKLVHLSIQPAKEPFVARIFKSLSELEGGEELVRRRDQSPIRSRASHWRKSPLKPMLSATLKLEITKSLDLFPSLACTLAD
jgi:hypothetical protein